ncbi:hypothetical protein DMJ13_20045 [halophilic archaeon]|nr:hypothetical protein DMJ13_20045 [halophilic archaeon]
MADTLDDAEPSIAELVDHMQGLTEHVEELEQTVAAKDDQIEELQQQVESLKEDRNIAEKKRASDRERLGELEETTEAIQDDVDNLAEKEEQNARVRASVSRFINLSYDRPRAAGKSQQVTETYLDVLAVVLQPRGIFLSERWQDLPFRWVAVPDDSAQTTTAHTSNRTQSHCSTTPKSLRSTPATTPK